MALATARFEEMARFYGESLGFPALDSWDRPGARGRMFDLGGLRLEVLDAARERRPMRLGEPDGRCQIVIEVADLDAVRAKLAIATPEPVTTSWGARLFQLRDPDGIAVWFMQRTGPPP